MSVASTSSPSQSQAYLDSSSSPTTQPARTPTFSEDRQNYHRVEFEAPSSAEPGGEQILRQNKHHAGEGRFSIDLSLELERELADMESPPITPSHDATTHSEGAKKENDAATRAAVVTGSSDLAPDPDILAHIITQLRQSLADITKERDDLVKMLAQANQRSAETQDVLQVITDKATGAEEELTELRQKKKEDEEQIAVLRTKVDESRRGLMRLQTESRRQSMTPIDISRASAMSLGSFSSTPSAKRASFVPLTGRPNGHKRVSSVSAESILGSFPTPDLTPSSNVQAFNISSPEATLSGAPSSARRVSGFYGRPEGDLLHSAASTEASNSVAVAEFDAMRKECQTLKDELEDAKHELREAREAKEASETCVTALREFIAENNVGAGQNTGMKLPPPPTMTTGAEEAEAKKTGTGWGFKLWGNNSGGVDSPLRTSIGGPHSAAPSPVIPPSATYAPSSTTPIGAAPLSRKLGGFFGSRSSISLSHSRDQSQSQAPQLQTNAAALVRTSSQRERDSMHSYSDSASSVAEPISPGSDINGLGTAPYVKAGGLGGEDTVIHDVTNLDGTPVRVSMSAADLDGLR